MYGLFFNALFDLAIAHWFFHLNDSACVTAPILSNLEEHQWLKRLIAVLLMSELEFQIDWVDSW